jgi:hypothetical protein
MTRRRAVFAGRRFRWSRPFNTTTVGYEDNVV